MYEMLRILKFWLKLKKSQYFWSDSKRLVSLQKRSKSKLTETKNKILAFHKTAQIYQSILL